jgi:twinkle protein
MINWNKYGIDVSKVVGGKAICPKCSHTRKNKRDKSLSVDLKTGLFNCHHSGCEFRGCALEIKKEKKVYTKPLERLEKLSKKSIEWFESRGISNNTLLRLRITESKEWMPQFEKEVTCICFNYYKGEELVNIKFRGPQKSFKLSKDAELVFYNLNSIQGEEEVIIVEGEMDCLSFYEAGIYPVVSVPNGASLGNQKLEYLDNCFDQFSEAKRIILAVDNDEAGQSLLQELARRLGKERCYTVSYPEGCKDANDVLTQFGKDGVQQLIESKKEFPIDGIITMDEMFNTICQWYEEGYPSGAKTGIPGLDELLTFAPGQLTVVTGIPGHGKDEYCNWIMAALAEKQNWRWGICGFEEEAEQTVTKLIEKFTGKAFDFRKDQSQRISVEEFQKGVYWVDRYFFFYKTEAIDTDIDSLLQIAETLVAKYGIQGLILNPWNWIENNYSDKNDTDYVSWVLSKIIRFARSRGVHVLLVAHTTKIPKEKGSGKHEVPNLYSISGSAHFYNKAHNGITVYRDEETVDVYVQKVKQSWLGQKGFSTYRYNTYTRQYEFQNCSAINKTRFIPLTDFTEPKSNL